MHSSYSKLSEVSTTCYSRGELHRIQVQVHIRGGLPKFDIIGLPQNMIREGKDRILSALSHLGIDVSTQKILISLNPGDIPKEGSHFDLPMLVGILKAMGVFSQITPSESLHPFMQEPSFFWGELGLDGTIRHCDNLLAHLLYANQFSPKALVSAGRENNIKFIDPYLSTPSTIINHLSELISPHLVISQPVHKSALIEENELTNENSSTTSHPEIDSEKFSQFLLSTWVSEDLENSRWNQLKGKPSQFLFWCLVALGRLHVLLEGAPGVGKSSWSFAMKELQFPLPSSSWHRRFCFHSHLSKQIKSLGDLFAAPFESPHHSSSKTAIVGGGSNQVCAGSLTRASGGILFLDELSEFNRDIIECLREPLETKSITIARSGVSASLPADIQFLAATNPCRCGRYRSGANCTCSTTQYHQYKSRISEPLRDRMHFTPWWEFFDIEREKQFDLRNVRAHLSDALKNKSPDFSSIVNFFPKRKNPRKQKIWIQIFDSWCRWFGIQSPTEKNILEFSNFLNEMEEVNDEHNRMQFEYLRDREIARINRATNVGSHLVP
ncbi:MAG: ATP-binding protein [Deltaproteobacteria bacterium]|nr:ATP-binding protein [Deltaproteobacteria bacterium]